MSVGAAGDDVGEGALSGSGGAVEDDGGQLIGLDGAAEVGAGTDDLVLADELIEGVRAHARGEGGGGLGGGARCLSVFREQAVGGVVGGHGSHRGDCSMVVLGASTLSLRPG